ncbi:hypothetical protein JCM19992_11780 [Thermostilla marina]
MLQFGLPSKLKIVTACLVVGMCTPAFAQSAPVVKPARTFSAAPQKALRTVSLDRVPVVAAIDRAANRPWLLAAGDDHCICLWDGTSGKPIGKLQGPTDWVKTVAVHPKTNRIACGDDAGNVWVWNGVDGGVLWHRRVVQGGIRKVVFDPTGRAAAVAAFDSPVMLLETDSGAEMASYEFPTSDVRDVRFAPGGERLAACGSQGMVRMWTLADGMAIDLPGMESRVHAIVWSPDGRYLAAVGEAPAIVVWDVTSRQIVHRIARGNVSPALTAVYCGSEELAVGRADNRIVVWHVPTGKPIATLEGHTGSVTCLMWMEDTQTLVSSGFDTTVRLWNYREALRVRAAAVPQDAYDTNYDR